MYIIPAANMEHNAIEINIKYNLKNDNKQKQHLAKNIQFIYASVMYAYISIYIYTLLKYIHA